MPAVSAFRRLQILPISLPAAWTFFSDPRNLAEITPEGMGFDILSAPPGRIYPGLILAYKVGLLPGIKATWVTEITHVRDLEYFVDEQRMGPYRFWHHEHHFRAVTGGVEVEDLVHYALPLGPLGRALAGRWVARRLTGIFDYRQAVLARKFGTA
ncbi:MAG TPA: SRPBCC family protein [Fibrobacteria bacterium]|nr:SRPBCC family protein [Fibrobacteria bacterium]